MKELIEGLLKKNPKERLTLREVIEKPIIVKIINDLKNEFPEIAQTISDIVKPRDAPLYQELEFKQSFISCQQPQFPLISSQIGNDSKDYEVKFVVSDGSTLFSGGVDNSIYSVDLDTVTVTKKFQFEQKTEYGAYSSLVINNKLIIGGN